MFQIGDPVCCRDSTNGRWLQGVVETTDPIKVRIGGWPVSFPFKFIRKQRIKVKVMKRYTEGFLETFGSLAREMEISGKSLNNVTVVEKADHFVLKGFEDDVVAARESIESSRKEIAKKRRESFERMVKEHAHRIWKKQLYVVAFMTCLFVMRHVFSLHTS